MIIIGLKDKSIKSLNSFKPDFDNSNSIFFFEFKKGELNGLNSILQRNFEILSNPPL